MLIAIASGKGGTGKTTIATNLAMSVEGEGITLVDCDVEEPNAHLFINPFIQHKWKQYAYVPNVDLSKCTFCGKCTEICQFNAIMTIKDSVLVFPELCHGCKGCEFVCPDNAISSGQKEIGEISEGYRDGIRFVSGVLRIGEAMAPPLIKQVKRSGNKNVFINAKSRNMILDAPPGTSCPVVEVVKDADYVILVTEPTPFGLYDLKLAVEMVRYLKKPFGLIINRSTIGNRDVWEYCKKEDITILMEIPDDTDIAKAYSKGEMMVNIYPEYKSKFKEMFSEIEKMIPEAKKESLNNVQQELINSH
jgi:MinD superfamily P-loop ATPase